MRLCFIGPAIREPGSANISSGVMGIVSVINEKWRQIAAIPGGVFFGLAAVKHPGRRPASKNKLTATVYDMYAFLMLACYPGFTLFA